MNMKRSAFLDSESKWKEEMPLAADTPPLRICAAGLGKAPYPITTEALECLDKDLHQRIQYALARYQQVNADIYAMQGLRHLAASQDYRAGKKLSSEQRRKAVSQPGKAARYRGLLWERAMYTQVLRCLVPLKRTVHAIWDQRKDRSSQPWDTLKLVHRVLQVIPLGSSWTSALEPQTKDGVQSAGKMAMQAVMSRHPRVFGELFVSSAGLVLKARAGRALAQETVQAAEPAPEQKTAPAKAREPARKSVQGTQSGQKPLTSTPGAASSAVRTPSCQSVIYEKIRAANVLDAAELGVLARMCMSFGD